MLSMEVCITAACWLQLGQCSGLEASAVVMAVPERWEKFPPSLKKYKLDVELSGSS